VFILGPYLDVCEMWALFSPFAPKVLLNLEPEFGGDYFLLIRSDANQFRERHDGDYFKLYMIIRDIP
jgi:hypothetical protein